MCAVRTAALKIPPVPRGYRVVLKPSERTPALAAGLDLYTRAARRLGLWGKLKRGSATDTDRRKIAERLSLDARREVRAQADRLLAGSIGRDAWLRRTRDILPARYYAGALAALGGRPADDLTVGDRAFIEAEIARQLAYLKRFSVELGTGERPLDGRVTGWADHYGGAVWGIGQNAGLRRAIAQGYTQGRRVLGPSDHCHSHGGLTGCIEQANLKWQDIKDVKPIGQSPCRGRCHCTLEFRKQVASKATAELDAGKSASRLGGRRRGVLGRLPVLPGKVARAQVGQ